VGVEEQRGRERWSGEKQVKTCCSGFSQKEGIDYEETIAPVARLEVIWILLAFSVAIGFKLHQMDVKSAFLNSVLEEEVYVRQPHRGLRVRSTPTGCTSWGRRCMGWSRHLELGMIGWWGSCFSEGLRWERSIRPCFYSSKAKIS
jgi:hypothetical protein